jgi:hypothetical protein
VKAASVPPEKLSAEELEGLSLQEIIPRLTAWDLELFAAAHGQLTWYCCQFKLCPPGADCWYCKKLDEERQGPRLVPEWDWFPFYTSAAEGGTRWHTLEERVAMLKSDETRDDAIKLFLSDSGLPSTMVADAFVAGDNAMASISSDLLMQLQQQTRLASETIQDLWEKMQRESHLRKEQQERRRQQQPVTATEAGTAAAAAAAATTTGAAITAAATWEKSRRQ